MLTDPRMEAVAKELNPPPKKSNPRSKKSSIRKKHQTSDNEVEKYKIPDPDIYVYDVWTDDPLVGFLTHAWAVRETWRNTHDKPKGYRKIELRQLKTACDTLHDYLNRDEFIATFALGFDKSGSHSLNDGQTNYLTLLKMLRRISNTLGRERKWHESGLMGLNEEELKQHEPVYPKVYAPYLDGEKSEEIFVIRYLSENMKKLFGKLHHDVVAITATVLLELPDNPNLTDRVADLWKHRPRYVGFF